MDRETGKRSIRPVCFLLMLLLGSSFLSAQNYSFDARKLALGGISNAGTGNIVFEMVPRRFGYYSIVIPFGLVQAWKDKDVFDPDKEEFDLVRIIDYVGNPFHYTYQRSRREGDFDFLRNVSDAELSRNLNDYRGFSPPENYLAEGLLAPNWGYTFKFLGRDNQSFQGFYVGAGPYLSLHTDLHFDPALLRIFASTQDVTVPNTSFFVTNNSSEQAAAAITGGYRAKFSLPGQSPLAGSERNGIYVAANYHYLWGLRYDSPDFGLNLETDQGGLITLVPRQTPLVIDQLTSTSGRGFALDFGVAVVLDHWEFGLGANGVANRIEWEKLKRKRFTLSNLLTEVGFADEHLPAPSGRLELNLPERYTGNIAYHADSWSALADVSHGFEKWSFHGGGEYRFSRIEFRGGGRFSKDRWEPAGGLGLNLTRSLSIDLAVFGNSANVNKERKLSGAVSVRINRGG